MKIKRYLQNDAQSLKAIVATAVGIIVLAAVLSFLLVWFINWSQTRPCETYRGYSMQSLPVRCIRYYFPEATEVVQ